MAEALLHTPLIEWRTFASPARRIFAKYEFANPTGSIKDRMASYILDAALRANLLQPSSTVIEASSGNTGAALALAARDRGLKAIIVTASSTAAEKIALIKSFGATVETVDTTGAPGAEIEHAHRLAQQNKYFYLNQFSNPFHVEAYRRALMPELLADLATQKIQIDTFVVGIGTGASAIAIGEELRKSHNPNLKIYAVTPARFPTDIEGLHPGDSIPQGHFEIWRNRTPQFESGTYVVEDSAAYASVFDLEQREHVLAGPATGAVLCAALQISNPGNTLILATDSGKKYTQKFALWRNEQQAVAKK